MAVPDSEIHLNLAGISLRVRLNAFEAQAAHARYRRFEAPETEASIEVRSSFDPRLRLPRVAEAWPGGSCQRRSGSLVLTRRDDQTVWDLAERYVRFVVAKSAPAEPLVETLPPFVETALRVVVATELVRAGGLLMHACGWADAERSVLFAGFSGGGKTTTAHKLPASEVLSDDQVAVRDGDAWSLPFVGEWNQRTSPKRAPLRAIALLGKSTSPGLRRLPPARALARLLGCVVSFDPAQAIETFQLAAGLVENVPVYELALDRHTPVAPWIERMLGG